MTITLARPAADTQDPPLVGRRSTRTGAARLVIGIALLVTGFALGQVLIIAAGLLLAGTAGVGDR